MENFSREDFWLLACFAQMFFIIFEVMQLKGITF